jgi:hypothetical protein
LFIGEKVQLSWNLPFFEKHTHYFVKSKTEKWIFGGPSLVLKPWALLLYIYLYILYIIYYIYRGVVDIGGVVIFRIREKLR